MSSVYLSEELKRRLVQAARRRGFSVGQGRQSELSDYIAYLIDLDSQSPKPPTLERALKLLDGYDIPQLGDEEVESLLHERRMNH